MFQFFIQGTLSYDSEMKTFLGYGYNDNNTYEWNSTNSFLAIPYTPKDLIIKTNTYEKKTAKLHAKYVFNIEKNLSKGMLFYHDLSGSLTISSATNQSTTGQVVNLPKDCRDKLYVANYDPRTSYPGYFAFVNGSLERNKKSCILVSPPLYSTITINNYGVNDDKMKACSEGYDNCVRINSSSSYQFNHSLGVFIVYDAKKDKKTNYFSFTIQPEYEINQSNLIVINSWINPKDHYVCALGLTTGAIIAIVVVVVVIFAIAGIIACCKGCCGSNKPKSETEADQNLNV